LLLLSFEPVKRQVLNKYVKFYFGILLQPILSDIPHHKASPVLSAFARIFFSGCGEVNKTTDKNIISGKYNQFSSFTHLLTVHSCTLEFVKYVIELAL
jgi:hypothetical protein